MKKINYLLSALVVVLFAGLASGSENPAEDTKPGTNASEETEDVESELKKSYFSIENATFKSGDMPAPTSSKRISGLNVNHKALAGGMNFITIMTEETYRKFYVGVKGIDGYWIYTPTTNPATRAEGSNSYTIPIMYSTNFASDITMMLSAEDENGDITEPYEAEINFVSSLSGDLNINLTFSNAKDVDLHLFMPNGEHIYYGARGGSVNLTNGSTLTYGLDKDSNAGCEIDNLNNENIYIPAELIQNGTYTVVVDMFSNCDSSIPTSWSVAARYKDVLVENTMGANPATGMYPVGAGNGDMSSVMTFTINESSTRSKVRSRIVPNSFKPTPLNEYDKMKLTEVEFLKNNN